ncbi:tetratricopeptide repeat protein [Microbaculum marinisediminis]|uniref:Tetratricopeptide repeat protein n=1 Tax=Microbaculum marinisediminis TaxID=2931392 RepID=A0AAW5QX07_9HYPH|nr:tetratricopeptide repeat protein [Microbaculum sp. A6E488]MCT8970864.1 tetratricopeptide repeat protein [Microbaculum sp. A6E488]
MPISVSAYLKCPVILLAAGLALGGCQKTLTTGSISKEAATQTAQAPGSQEQLKQAAKLQDQFKRDPGNADVALAFADALDGLGRSEQAVGALKMAKDKNPSDPRILSAYGRRALRAGNPNEALAALEQASSAGDRSAATLSAQGAALDQLGRNGEARERYKQALSLDPNNSSILANLGLSYALSNKIADAEMTLRKAASNPTATPKVRQNLALVLAMQGKFAEAEDYAARDLSPEDVKVNMAYLKQMMKTPDPWQKLKNIDGATG